MLPEAERKPTKLSRCCSIDPGKVHVLSRPKNHQHQARSPQEGGSARSIGGRFNLHRPKRGPASSLQLPASTAPGPAKEDARERWDPRFPPGGLYEQRSSCDSLHQFLSSGDPPPHAAGAGNAPSRGRTALPPRCGPRLTKKEKTRSSETKQFLTRSSPSNCPL